MLGLDLLIFRRRPHAVSMKESLSWVAIWVSLAGIFNIGLTWFYGRQVAMEFLTGSCIEEALSVDHLFVFLVIFSYFSVPKELQHRVLFFVREKARRMATRAFSFCSPSRPPMSSSPSIPFRPCWLSPATP